MQPTPNNAPSLSEIEQQEKNLQDQLKRTQLLKQDAAWQEEEARKNQLKLEREQKLAQIAEFENQSISFRNEAQKATNKAEKKGLYLSADGADEQANVLKRELNIFVPADVVDPKLEVVQAQVHAKRIVNGLAFKTVLSILVYFFCFSIAGNLDQGTTSYILTAVGKLAKVAASCFGAFWLIGYLLLRFISDYLFNDLQMDFDNAHPRTRLNLIVVLIAVLIYFLSGVLRSSI